MLGDDTSNDGVPKDGAPKDGALNKSDPNDGDPGSAVMPDSLSAAANGGGARLYLASGPARFAEAKGVFDEIGNGGWTLALGTQDLDGDGRPELYLANDFGPDRLLVNESVPGRIRFTEARGTRHLTTPPPGSSAATRSRAWASASPTSTPTAGRTSW